MRTHLLVHTHLPASMIVNENGGQREKKIFRAQAQEEKKINRKRNEQVNEAYGHLIHSRNNFRVPIHKVNSDEQTEEKPTEKKRLSVASIFRLKSPLAPSSGNKTKEIPPL